MEAIPVRAEPSPVKLVAPKAPVLALKVRLEPLLGARSPVAAVTNNGKQVVSLDSSATVISVGVEAIAAHLNPPATLESAVKT